MSYVNNGSYVVYNNSYGNTSIINSHTNITPGGVFLYNISTNQQPVNTIVEINKYGDISGNSFSGNIITVFNNTNTFNINKNINGNILANPSFNNPTQTSPSNSLLLTTGLWIISSNFLFSVTSATNLIVSISNGTTIIGNSACYSSSSFTAINLNIVYYCSTSQNITLTAYTVKGAGTVASATAYSTPYLSSYLTACRLA
jgi:hypothetical protein